MAKKKFSEFVPKNAPDVDKLGAYVVGVDQTTDENFKIAVPHLMELAVNAYYKVIPLSGVTSYTLAHGLNRYPIISCIETNGTLVHPLVVYSYLDTVEFTFNPAFTGNIVYI